MRYIEKKSTAKLNPVVGSVSDTLNVTDEISNAPSVRVVKEMKEDITETLKLKQYSESEEVVIGTWVNGKPIYRKVYNTGGLLAQTTAYSIETGNLYIEDLITLRGFARTNAGLHIPLPYIANINTDMTSALVSLWYLTSNNTICIRNMKDKSDHTTAYIILEYTKTTD